MASIDHQASLDTIDVLSVLTYRLGWLSLSVALILASYSAFANGAIYQPLWLLSLPLILLSLNLHLYIKSLRYYIQVCAGACLWLMLAAQHWDLAVLNLLAISSAYLVFSALSFKESFCFKFGALRWLGFIFAGDWLLIAMNHPELRPYSLLLLSAACIYIALAKICQPLHYDIGDKSQYQH